MTITGKPRNIEPLLDGRLSLKQCCIRGSIAFDSPFCRAGSCALLGAGGKVHRKSFTMRDSQNHPKCGIGLMDSMSPVPGECRWYDDGKWGSSCYANNGFQGFMKARLNKGQGDPVGAAREEASLIDTLSGARPLRLHVVGDCKDGAAATIVSAASEGSPRPRRPRGLDLYSGMGICSTRVVGRRECARFLRIAGAGPPCIGEVTRPRSWRASFASQRLT